MTLCLCNPPVHRQTVTDDGADGIAAGLQRPLVPLVSRGPAEIQSSLTILGIQNTNRGHTNTLRTLGTAGLFLSGVLISLLQCIECFGLMCFLECQKSLSCKIQVLVDLLLPIDSFPECNMDIRAGARRAIGMVITVEIKYHQSKSNNPTSDPQPSLLSSCIFFHPLLHSALGFIFLHISPPPSTLLFYHLVFLSFAARAYTKSLAHNCVFFLVRPFHVRCPRIAFANANELIRQMTLITVHLE